MTKAKEAASSQEGSTAKSEEKAVRIQVPRLLIKIAKLTIVGDEPLICSNWSEKAKQEMRDKQQGEPKNKKAPKNPRKEYEATLYHYPGGGYGFPSIAFKAAAVAAWAGAEGVRKGQVQGAFHILGELVKLEGVPRMREDMVRVGPMKVADIRYRAEFPKWKARLTIRYNSSLMTLAQIVHMLNLGGFGVGVGNWRPAKNGNKGQFHVAGEAAA